VHCACVRTKYHGIIDLSIQRKGDEETKDKEEKTYINKEMKAIAILIMFVKRMVYCCTPVYTVRAAAQLVSNASEV
jgi:hypothetical protein